MPSTTSLGPARSLNEEVNILVDVAFLHELHIIIIVYPIYRVVTTPKPLNMPEESDCSGMYHTRGPFQNQKRMTRTTTVCTESMSGIIRMRDDTVTLRL